MTSRLIEDVAAAQAVLADLDAARQQAVPAAVAFGRLYRHASDPATDDADLAARLAAEPRLQADFRAVLERVALYHAPIAAAAADAAALDQRHGNGWTLLLRPSRNGREWWVLITFETVGAAARLLFAGGERRVLPAADGNRIQLRLPPDSALLAAIRDPGTPLFLT